MSQIFKKENGEDIPIRCTCIDSGGHYTQAVYNFVRPRERKRIFAIKGVGGEGRPIISRPSKNNIGKIRLFSVGVDTTKELIYARLRISEPGPGYCHFPNRYDDEYFLQLTAEQVVMRFSKGFRKREWKKVRTRNEALDLRVYAIAAYTMLNANINTLIDRKIKTAAAPTRRTNTPTRRNGNFANGWK